MPGVVSSLVLIIIGAIARYAYSDSIYNWGSGQQSHSLRIDTIGLILLIAGIIGLLLSILWSFLRPRYLEIDETERSIKRPIRNRSYDTADEIEPSVKTVKRNRSRDEL